MRSDVPDCAINSCDNREDQPGTAASFPWRFAQLPAVFQAEVDETVERVVDTAAVLSNVTQAVARSAHAVSAISVWSVFRSRRYRNLELIVILVM
jgi:hypothetical protein